MKILIPARVNKTLKFKIESLGSYVLNHMVADSDRELLRVNVRFDSKIDSEGICEPAWDEDLGLDKQTELNVALNRNYIFTNDQLLRLIAHEFIHVGQMANGSFKLTENGEFWHGEYIDDSLYTDPYFERPEEIEAYSLEGKMLDGWKKCPSVPRELLI